MGKKRDLSASGERSLTFTRARWKHFTRYFGVFVIVMLNISLVLSTIQIHMTHPTPDIDREILSFVFVLFFDVTVLIPILFEVDRVFVTADKIVFKTLFWTAKIPWTDIRWFKNPIYLTFAIVRTTRLFYLINKKDVTPIDELVETIEHKLARANQ